LSTSDQSAANKRSQKQSAKNDVKQVPVDSNEPNSTSSPDDSHSHEPNSDTRYDPHKLTKKKQLYMEQAIKDKDGNDIRYLDDPDQYKKARKRQQNRESAVRSRIKKREEVEDLEVVVRRL